MTPVQGNKTLLYRSSVIGLRGIQRLREALADWSVGANLNDATSENGLGILNMQGIPGVMAPDPKAGLNWFRKAAAQGDEMGIRNLNTALATQLPANEVQ
jgi:TPR repeat protein